MLHDKEPQIILAFDVARKQGNPQLRAALDRWFAGPPNDVSLATDRGLPLLSVADGDLKTFEHDDALKSYGELNHMFADLFGGVYVKWPIVLFLSRANPPAVHVETIRDPGISLVYLGQPYSLAEITAAFSSILSEQGIRLVRPRFVRILRDAGINPSDPSFSSFASLSTSMASFLQESRGALLGQHTIVVTQAPTCVDVRT